MTDDRWADLRHWLSELQGDGSALFKIADVRELLALAEPEEGRCQTRAGALVAALGIGIPEGTRCVLRDEHAGWHVAPDGATWHGPEPKAQISEPAARALAACRGEVAYLTDALTLERAEARIVADQVAARVAELDRIREVLLEVSRLSPAALGSYALWARLQLATGGSDA